MSHSVYQEMKHILIKLFLITSYYIIYGLRCIWLFELPDTTFKEYYNNRWKDESKNSPYRSRPIKHFIFKEW